jgi:hypothetical protein
MKAPHSTLDQNWEAANGRQVDSACILGTAAMHRTAPAKQPQSCSHRHSLQSFAVYKRTREHCMQQQPCYYVLAVDQTPVFAAVTEERYTHGKTTGTTPCLAMTQVNCRTAPCTGAAQSESDSNMLQPMQYYNSYMQARMEPSTQTCCTARKLVASRHTAAAQYTSAAAMQQCTLSPCC